MGELEELETYHMPWAVLAVRMLVSRLFGIKRTAEVRVHADADAVTECAGRLGYVLLS